MKTLLGKLLCRLNYHKDKELLSQDTSLAGAFMQEMGGRSWVHTYTCERCGRSERFCHTSFELSFEESAEKVTKAVSLINLERK